MERQSLDRRSKRERGQVDRCSGRRSEGRGRVSQSNWEGEKTPERWEKEGDERDRRKRQY